jgi:cation:H+ antiporter
MRTVLAVTLALLAAVPAAMIRIGAIRANVELETLLFGFAIVGASFAMAWGAEAAEHDIPRALALSVVALLAVFPEYAVDIVFAYKAGQDPTFAPYAAANMTGSNRLLLGLGWPTISVIAWLVRGKRHLGLSRDAVLPLFFLTVATLYSFILPLKQSIGLIDTLFLFALFLVYAALAARENVEEPDLVGPAATIGSLRPAARRLSVIGLLLFAGASIGASAAPFADGLVRTGQALGIDEFLLVQWLAPLASEAPEFLVAALLAARGKSSAALGLMLSAKLNQWTLLVGSLPLAYVIGVVTTSPPATAGWQLAVMLALPLDARQIAEVALTAAQGLLGVAVLANLVLDLGEALMLAVLFLGQFILGSALRAGTHNTSGADQELFVFTLAYLALSLVFAVRARKVIGALWRRGRRASPRGASIEPRA